VWSLGVGGGKDSGPAESTRGWTYGTRENPRQRGLVSEGVRDRNERRGERQRVGRLEGKEAKEGVVG
jgi:hypothetical protein